MTGEIDYRRAFKIACDLLNGAVLYGIDSDEIFKTMMDRDGVVTKESYEEYILNHLQELDHGEYAIKSLEQEPCEDAISRQEVLDLIADYDLSMGQVVRGIHALPSVTPQEPILDKIRAEIETKYGQCKLTEYIVQYDGICTSANDIGDIADILQIIDKHKAESEDQDGQTND